MIHGETYAETEATRTREAGRVDGRRVAIDNVLRKTELNIVTVRGEHSKMGLSKLDTENSNLTID